MASDAASQLFKALYDRDTDKAVQLLSTALEAGTFAALLSTPDAYGRSLFMFAAACGNQHVISQLLAAGAAQMQLAHAGVALHAAAVHGYAGIVQLLLDAGVSVDVKDDKGLVTPLHKAVFTGHAGVVEVLLSAGADVSARYAKDAYTLLMLASQLGREAVVEALLATPQGRATVNLVSQRHDTALHFAARERDAAAMLVLLNAGADPLLGKQGRRSPLATAARAAMRWPDDTCLDLLLTHPSTAGAWPASTLAEAAVSAAVQAGTARQHKVVSRLLMLAAQQDAAAMYAAIQRPAPAWPIALRRITQICMQEWLAADAAGPGVPAEQRTVQQLVVGAVGLLREQQPDEGAEEGGEEQQQSVCELQSALQAQQLSDSA